jgi:hypothetical protein
MKPRWRAELRRNHRCTFAQTACLGVGAGACVGRWVPCLHVWCGVFASQEAHSVRVREVIWREPHVTKMTKTLQPEPPPPPPRTQYNTRMAAHPPLAPCPWAGGGFECSLHTWDREAAIRHMPRTCLLGLLPKGGLHCCQQLLLGRPADGCWVEAALLAPHRESQPEAACPWPLLGPWSDPLSPLLLVG